jgi:hypothetical protein
LVSARYPQPSRMMSTNGLGRVIDLLVLCLARRTQAYMQAQRTIAVEIIRDEKL